MQLIELPFATMSVDMTSLQLNLLRENAMSLIAEYRQTQQAVEELQARLQALSTDDRLKKELEFEEKLRGLMGEYGKSLRDVITLLDPQASTKRAPTSAAPATRKPRQVKVYKNPENGEIIETKGGNHKTLKEWKAKHGADIVEGWATVK